MRTAFLWGKVSTDWDMGDGSTTTLPLTDQDREIADLKKELAEKEKEIIAKDKTIRDKDNYFTSEKGKWSRERNELEKKLKVKEPISTIPKELTPKEIKWQNIHRDFNEELINQWENKRFTYEQTREWIDIGLSVNDANFCAWLKNTKRLTPEWCLNHGDLNFLRKEYKK